MSVPVALSKVRRRLVLWVLMLCSVLIWVDNTVLSTALTTLADPVRGLGAGPGALQWATGAYTLAFATLMFSAGAVGDLEASAVVRRSAARRPASIQVAWVVTSSVVRSSWWPMSRR